MKLNQTFKELNVIKDKFKSKTRRSKGYAVATTAKHNDRGINHE